MHPCVVGSEGGGAWLENYNQDIIMAVMGLLMPVAGLIKVRYGEKADRAWQENGDEGVKKPR